MPAPGHVIFISYRRSDSIYAVDRLEERLKQAFGADSVFRDVRSIRKGQSFPQDIRASLLEAAVGLVVIGPWWLDAVDERKDGAEQYRLHDPGDWVRIEVETLLRRALPGGGPVPVIPVFIGGAEMPRMDYLPDPLKSLAERSGLPLRPEPEFEDSVRSLIEHIGTILGVAPQQPAANRPVATDPPPRVSPTRLAVTGKKFVGRELELHLLDEAWGRSARDKINIVSLIGQGGEGKTAIVLEWYSRRARHGWQGARRIFDWSFYSQGTSTQGSASADEFFSSAFQWLGHEHEVPKDPRDKGAKLAELVAAERTLLVLDGVEPLQHPPGGYGGEFKDPAMKTLLRGLAMQNPGLCILTSRVDLADLADFDRVGGSCLRHPLNALDLTTAHALLRELGVLGPVHEFDEAIAWFHHHAYDLNLLGNYVSQCTADQDIRGWRERFPILGEDERIHPVTDATGKQAGHGRRMLRAYVRWLRADSAAVAVLRLLGLFDRPARSDLLDELRARPAIAGLTNALVDLPDDEWQRTLSQLEQLALIRSEEMRVAPKSMLDDGTKAKRPRRSVDAHPLLREHFAAELREQHPDAWRAAHKRLYEYLRDTTQDRPQPTLADLQPLYQAIGHGCQAGLHQEAHDQIHYKRIRRGEEYYSLKRLGAFASDLSAISYFFETPWSQPTSQITDLDQGVIFEQAAFCLRALGRLKESFEPMRSGMAIHVTAQRWSYAAIPAGNLSEIELALGDVAMAEWDAGQSVTYADRSGHELQRVKQRAKHANAMHQAGRRSEAESRFREAEQMQADNTPDYPLLYSLRGFQYCDLLLAAPERAAWQHFLGLKSQPSTPNLSDSCRAVAQRAAQTLPIAERRGDLLTIALDHLTLGRAALYAAVLQGSDYRVLTPDLFHIDAAMAGLRRSGQQDDLPRGLFTRAWLRFLTDTRNGPESAQSDLNETWEIAERGPMKLFLIDIHLYRARLFFRESHYPWESPQADLAAAERLINECGYHRRDEELDDARTVFLSA